MQYPRRKLDNYEKINDLNEIKRIFNQGLKAMREKEKKIEVYSRYFFENIELLKEKVAFINGEIEKRRQA